MSFSKRYNLGEIVAIAWNFEMRERFPNADHVGCRGVVDFSGVFSCRGWHCNRCGVPTNMYGHHDCPDRPQQ